MGTSAFDLLVAPVFMATSVAMVAGAVLVGLVNAAEILIGRSRRMARPARPRPTVLRDPRIRPGSDRPRVAGRPGLVG